MKKDTIIERFALGLIMVALAGLVGLVCFIAMLKINFTLKSPAAPSNTEEIVIDSADIDMYIMSDDELHQVYEAGKLDGYEQAIKEIDSIRLKK